MSVVIPTYNRRALLQEAVASCLNQTWQHLEVIIVDDGSTDGTGQMVADLLGVSWSRDRMRYLRQVNQGASRARNYGLRVARGDYVQFLDSDDLLDPAKLAMQIEMLDRPENRQIVCCSCYGILGKRAAGRTVGLGMRIGVRTEVPRDLVRELCSRRVHGMSTPAPLWRREFLVQRPGWREDITLGDDLEYYVRLIVDAGRIGFVDRVLFFVREHGGSQLSADPMTEASLASLIRTRRSVFKTVECAGLWDGATQGTFLHAMRTIYANALTLGRPDIIRELESWLWSLTSRPRRRYGIRALILLRQLLGRRLLLTTHRLVKNLRVD